MGCKRSRPIVSGLLFTIEKPTRTCGRQSILPPALRVSGAERPLERHPPRTFARSNRPETPHRPAAPDPHFPEHMMSPVSRRFVLTGAALTTASLLVPITVRASRAEDDYEITDWIVIAPSGEVTLALSQPEVGQGSYTALPQILADELDADRRRVKVRFVTGKAAYKIAFRQEPPAQKEGASMSTTALFGRLCRRRGPRRAHPRRGAAME